MTMAREKGTTTASERLRLRLADEFILAFNITIQLRPFHS
jgi:hypothetical protein